MKPLEGFYTQKKRDGSRHPTAQCRECIKVKTNAYYWANHEKALERKREYVRTHPEEERARTLTWMARLGNPERKKAWDRAWRTANPERKAANDRAWGRANRDKANVNWRRFKERHPERVRENSWVQGQKRRGEKPSATTRAYREIIKRDPCCYCGETTDEIDHIVPRNDWDGAGWNEWSNLTASCQKCNRPKSDRPLLTFLLIC